MNDAYLIKQAHRFTVGLFNKCTLERELKNKAQHDNTLEIYKDSNISFCFSALTG